MSSKNVLEVVFTSTYFFLKVELPEGVNKAHKVIKDRDSKNDWRGSCEIKMNNL